MAETETNWCSEEFSFINTWRRLAKEANDELGQTGGYRDSAARERDALLLALPRFLLECYAEHIRHRRGRAWAPLAGRKAVEMMVIEKHGWLPAAAESLSDSEIMLALHEELEDCCWPPEVYEAAERWFYRHGMLSHIEHLAPDGQPERSHQG